MRAGNQSICSLQAFLQLAAHTDKLVIFDLYRPPRGHPYRDTWIQRTLEVIRNESSIHSYQVGHSLGVWWDLKGGFIINYSGFQTTLTC